MRRAPRRPAALFVLLACILVLQPIAGASQAGGGAIGGALAWLGCSCKSCPLTRRVEPVKRCCERREPARVEAPRRDACCAAKRAQPPIERTRSESRCPCLHPGGMPIPDDQPIGSGGAAELLAHCLRATEIATREVVRFSADRDASAARDRAFVPRDAVELARSSGFAARRLLERGALGFLSALGTALI